MWDIVPFAYPVTFLEIQTLYSYIYQRLEDSVTWCSSGIRRSDNLYQKT